MISRYGWLYLAFVAVTVVIQIAAGADLFVLACLTYVAALGAIPISRSNMVISDALFFTMTLFYGTLALAIKSIVFQPVQSNLVQPVTSASYLVIGFTSIAVAYAATRFLRIESLYFADVRRQFRVTEFLARWSKPVFLVGFVLYSAHTLLRANVQDGGFEEGGFGGFGSFYPLFVLGVAMQVGLCVARPQARSELVWLAFMGLAALGLSSAGNAKRVVFDYLVVIGVSYFAYRIRLRPWVIGAGAALGIVMIFYFQPAIQIVRAQNNVSAIDRLPATWKVLEDNSFNPIRLSEAAEDVTAGYKVSYAQSYIYPVAWNTERYTMILPVDEVARTLPGAGTMGIEPALRDMLQNILPSLFIAKRPYALSDQLAWHFGFRDTEIIGRPVTGLVASSVGTAGAIGLILLPGLMAEIAFLILDLVGGTIIRSPFGVFITASNLIIAERDITLVANFFRDFLIMLAFVALLTFIGRIDISRRQSRRLNGTRPSFRHEA